MKALAIFITLLSPLAAETLHCSGVLGNSGEQGAALVRFAAKPASGMGVVYDASGSLWDRAGDGQLNRYAADGRLLASYPLPPGGAANERDQIAQGPVGLLIKVGRKLYLLANDAASGTAPQPLSVEANRLSANHHEGWFAAALDKSVFLVNSAGETKPVATLDDNVTDIAIGPDDGIYVSSNGEIRRVDSFAPADRRGPWPSPGDRAQWLAGAWFGSAWHGTLRRFDAQLQPDPGVVLGGASGSFIGYVPGNHELNDARGLAQVRGQLFAASGSEGILHLLEWQPAARRFSILRRIGAVPTCSALAMDGSGRIWFYSGFWEWSDAPDTPLRHSVPPPQSPGFAGAIGLPGGNIAAPGIRWGKPSLYYGKGDGPASLSEDIPLPRDAIACTLTTAKDRPALLVTDDKGTGRLLLINSEGKYEGDGGPSELPGITTLTSLTYHGNEILAATANSIVRFTPQDSGFRETARWNSWGDSPADHFGESIHATADSGRLWVSDSTRHRVLCFDAASRKLLGSFGTPDQAGTSLSQLDRPTTIAARGDHAVVFDSGNQRLIKLELSE
ncbi:hypothetical protein [Haloferula sp. BvORR071]|uniref:hypothetical protein n=1 Tax=Haloferula sp. BvORR071 TaxID=1396141 RepID=UPI00055443A5|nr:hypothetical protein [Haloferula sp. BvORR071]